MNLFSKKDHTGFAIVVSWPETKCKQAGAWYDGLMKFLGFNKHGYYQVGHSAIVLIADGADQCHYFDFGRYHAPHGSGRVRSEETDHELTILTKAKISVAGQLLNVEKIMQELYANESTHGTGYIMATVVRINFMSAIKYVRQMQDQVFIRYGPLVWNGTNCSRFVAGALNRGGLSLVKLLRLNLQKSISASPVGNVRAIGEKLIYVGQAETEREQSAINKETLVSA